MYTIKYVFNGINTMYCLSIDEVWHSTHAFSCVKVSWAAFDNEDGAEIDRLVFREEDVVLLNEGGN